MKPISIQLFSLREELSENPRKIFKELYDMGYSGVELHGDLYGLTKEEFADAIKDSGLSVTSAHLSLETLLERPEEFLPFYQNLGCKYIALPYLMPNRLPGNEDWDNTISAIECASETCKKYGIQLCFHNHNTEFQLYEDKYILDHLFDNTTRDTLMGEFDLGWVMASGVDPSEFLQTYADKCAIIHLKDFYREKGNTERPHFRPLGYGIVNIPYILDTLNKIDDKIIIVEQDDPAFDKSGLECAKMSIEYLKTIMQ